MDTKGTANVELPRLFTGEIEVSVTTEMAFRTVRRIGCGHRRGGGKSPASRAVGEERRGRSGCAAGKRKASDTEVELRGMGQGRPDAGEREVDHAG